MKQQLLTTTTPLLKRSGYRPFQPRVGAALFFNRRIPLRYKLGALLLGFGAMVILQLLEIPLEAFTVLFASPIGIEDGLEAALWPVVFAFGFLPRLVPLPLQEECHVQFR